MVYRKHCLHCKNILLTFSTYWQITPSTRQPLSQLYWRLVSTFTTGIWYVIKGVLSILYNSILLQLSHICIWGSILSWFVFVPIYAQVWYVHNDHTYKISSSSSCRPTLPIGSEMIGLVRTHVIAYVSTIIFLLLPRTQDYLEPPSSTHSLFLFLVWHLPLTFFTKCEYVY